jgi:hypothetical protein
VFFVFASTNVVYCIYRFVCVESPLHPWDEADLVMVYDLSDVLLIRFAIILLRISASIFIKEIGLQFSFLEVSLSGFGMRVMLAS